MGLRLGEGVDLAALSRRFGLPRVGLIDQRKLALHAANGLVREDGDRLVVTDQGMPLLDALLPDLIALEPELT